MRDHAARAAAGRIAGARAARRSAGAARIARGARLARAGGDAAAAARRGDADAARAGRSVHGAEAGSSGVDVSRAASTPDLASIAASIDGVEASPGPSAQYSSRPHASVTIEIAMSVADRSVTDRAVVLGTAGTAVIIHPPRSAPPTEAPPDRLARRKNRPTLSRGRRLGRLRPMRPERQARADRGPARPVAPSRASVTDRDLVARARSGDDWAKGALFRRYARDVGDLATRLLGRMSDADDVVQDTFIDAFRTLDTLREPSAFRAWVVGIAVRRVQRRHRKRKLLARLGLDRAPSDATLESLVSDAASPERRAELAMIDRALERCPSDARLAWMLRRVEGEELAAIAEMLSISIATVKRRVAEIDARIDPPSRGGPEA
jgi:RNA polymerase sigma-70 factor (ECF subfamily)